MALRPIKIALLGNTGVGKDTFVKILESSLKEHNLFKIKLAEPIYKAQEFIYDICKINKNHDTQDGVLLNFLGQHMRFINPDVIKENFLLKLKNISLYDDIVICSDSRPLDIPFIRKEGFLIVHICCSPQVSLKRRQMRGDISLANSQHCTEKEKCQEKYDYEITNDGSFEEYEMEILELMSKIHDTYQ